MAELDNILESIHEWSERGLEFALATVVGVRGSTYRGLGARQLVGADGAGVGTVSGGCLDQDLHRVALEVIEGGEARIVEFDLTADDEAIWGWGIGCNGATRLLVEPAGAAADLAARIQAARAEQRPVAVTHVLDPGTSGLEVGARRYDLLSGESEGTLGGIDSEVAELARHALETGHHELATVGDVGLFIEVIGAPSRLVICGAGHDAAPVARYGVELGFEVVVVDDRRQVLTRERFPGDVSLVCGRPADLADHVEIDRRTYVVIMSHNYLRDLDYLRSLIGTDVAYIGALGPGARLERLLKDLEADGVEVGEHDLQKIYAPAGLDVGAEGPQEIAWAILAEILAVRRGKEAGFLRRRKGPDVLRRLP